MIKVLEFVSALSVPTVVSWFDRNSSLIDKFARWSLANSVLLYLERSPKIVASATIATLSVASTYLLYRHRRQEAEFAARVAVTDPSLANLMMQQSEARFKWEALGNVLALAVGSWAIGCLVTHERRRHTVRQSQPHAGGECRIDDNELLLAHSFANTGSAVVFKNMSDEPVHLDTYHPWGRLGSLNPVDYFAKAQPVRSVVVAPGAVVLAPGGALSNAAAKGVVLCLNKALSGTDCKHFAHGQVATTDDFLRM